VNVDAGMIRKRCGVVTDILETRPGYVEIMVMTSGREEKAIVYPDLVGPVEHGDEVVLNTTAVSLDLGTGGFHFVIDNATNSQLDVDEYGHIMKLRYTPMQVKVLAVEEETSPFHERLESFESMEGMPVVIALLHSMIPPVFAAIKELSKDALKTTYIMTDGGALPISFSRLVHDLKKCGLIDSTITCGHAFGGDYECVNIYSALATAKQVSGADIAVVCMGPGIVGTGTSLGFTGIEQAQITDAVNALGGIPIVIPRIGFGDKRERHRGISHHTLTVLTKISHTTAYVALPVMDEDKAEVVRMQLKESGVYGMHEVFCEDGAIGLERLKRDGISVTTMGRTMEQEPEFFLAAGAAGVLAYNCLCK
jgi:hypothetical protein